MTNTSSHPSFLGSLFILWQSCSCWKKLLIPFHFIADIMSGHYLFTKLASFSLFLFIFHQNRPERERGERERPNEAISFLPHSHTHTLYFHQSSKTAHFSVIFYRNKHSSTVAADDDIHIMQFSHLVEYTFKSGENLRLMPNRFKWSGRRE